MPLLDKDGISLHYESIAGAAQPIVFIHGWCCDHTFFQPQAAYFAALGHHIISPDLRGHGQSDKPEQSYPITAFSDDLVWMCRELNVIRPILIGHSMGGIIAFDIAMRYPDFSAAIVMLDAAIVLPDAARAAVPAFLESLEGPAPANALRDFVGSVFFIPTDDPDRKRRILDVMANAPQYVMVSAYRGLADYNAETTPSRVAVPSLYIVADEPSARTDMARLQKLIPDLNIGRTVGSGHFCQLEVPDQINAMLSRFIEIAMRPN